MHYPELCKVVKTDKKRRDSVASTNSEEKREKEQIEKGGVDVVNISQIKRQISKYVLNIKLIIEEIDKKVKLGTNTKKGQLDADIHRELIQISSQMYNGLTLQILKLLKLIIRFGKFNIKVYHDKSMEEFMIKNKEFFEIFKTLIMMFEFDKMYPEARRILNEKRKGI